MHGHQRDSMYSQNELLLKYTMFSGSSLLDPAVCFSPINLRAVPDDMQQRVSVRGYNYKARDGESEDTDIHVLLRSCRPDGEQYREHTTAAGDAS